MAFVNPTIQQFQQQFIRDFPYGTDPAVAVLDYDILLAMQFSDLAINTGLWPNQSAYSVGYNLLTAHFLVLNLRASSQGLNGQYNWAQNSKAVAGVSEGFEIPQRLKDNPDFMAYTKTNYGAAYLNLLWPLLCGVSFVAPGRTHP